MPRIPSSRTEFPFACVLILIAGLSVPARAGSTGKLGFNRDIRPILSGTCFFCHGPDEKKREANLRLDVRESALADHDGSRAIVPGQPDQSELIARVLSHDKDDAMPPPKTKRAPLSPEQIATLRKWIAQGAPYESHWSFLPVRRDPPPRVKDQAWVKNPIDQFILARLETEGIAPSPEADPATLCRRLYLDLIGLLPSPEETRAFVAAATEIPKDQRSGLNQAAIDQLVDQLLANPHYGERWGRHWLDQARYADSNGYTIDSERAMWPYRDWVIKALNDDMPFDRFTIEQLAGDLLPNPTKSQIIATAFHRNTLINEEGGADKEQFRNESVVDRVNTTGVVWLGLTVGCAQCHSHKFDPISHREYYEMFAFFNQGTDVNNKGATLPVARGEVFGGPAAAPAPPPPDNAEIARLEADWEKREFAKYAAPAHMGHVAQAQWTPADYVEYDTASGAGFQLLDDHSLLADGRGASNDTYRIVANTSLKQVAAVRLRVLTHDSLPHRGPGLAGNGNFVLTQFEVNSGGAGQEIVRANADLEQTGFPAAAAIDDQPKTGWAINPGKGGAGKMNSDHEIVFVLAKPIVAQGGPIEIKLHHDLNQNYLIGRFALDFSASPPPAGKAPDALFAALQGEPEKRSETQKKLVGEAFERAEPKARLAKNAKASGDAELMVMKDLEQPRPTFIHLRGDFLRNDEKTGPLKPGVIAAVNSAFRKPQSGFRNRLDLAKWIVNPDNPLTPRVAMNRVWMHYFGRGMVETDEDFGAQGSAPTHPELLDWLAREFVQRGWSMKAMHRLIATSATYRQSSRARPDLAEKDPRNLLLARQERVRLDAEILRDAALSASGLLDPTIGGPSVHPPQAAGVYAFTQNTKKWTTDTGPNRFRRALYTLFYRAAPYPLFTTFDAPDFQSTCTRRARSDTPLQALTVANDAAFVEMAQGLAARLLQEDASDDPTARLRRAFLLCLSREPSEKELKILRAYCARQEEDFRNDPGAANALLTDSLRKTGIPPERSAAAVCAARAIFNMDNFITRE
jgi:Protein of unknown function (DUF1553)/Protein of unknown function (DUF1549)/Planctomycete cytochrome C